MRYLENKFIFVPFRLPFDWPCDFINQTCNLLSAQNYILAFLWADALSIKEILLGKKKFTWISFEGKLIKFTPIFIIPFRRIKFIERLNLRLNLLIVNLIKLKLGINKLDNILWIFEPEFEEWLGHFRNFTKIYDCVDYFSSSDRLEDQKIQRRQSRLIREVDVMFVNSNTLLELHKSKRRDIGLVPQGFRLDTFMKSGPLKYSSKINKTVGYIGGINYRLDLDLLIRTINLLPDYQFLIAGPIQYNNNQDPKYLRQNIDELSHLPNVKMMVLSKDQVPAFLSNISVGLIPYTLTKFNLNCFPMKVLEYFYFGLPVVSTEINELKMYYKENVIIANSPKQFAKAIETAASTNTLRLMKEKRKIAESHSWINKINAIDRYLTGNVQGKN